MSAEPKDRWFNDVVIVAAGLGTRMGDYSNGIPKLLINVCSSTVLERIVDSYGRDLRYRIICHSKHYPIIARYAEAYLSGVTISIKCVDEALGSAYALSKGAADLMDGRSVLVTWSDVYLKRQLFQGAINAYPGSTPLNDDTFKEPTIFTTPSRGCRYVYDQNTFGIRKLNNLNGNVIGIYYVPSFKTFDFNEGEDFVDNVHKLSPTGLLRELRLGCTDSEPVDVGDANKLQAAALLEPKPSLRSFNSIVDLGHDKILKKPRTELGCKLAELESLWYVAAAGRLLPIPNVWLSTSTQSVARSQGIIMDRVTGFTVAEEISRSSSLDHTRRVITAHIDAVSQLHKHHVGKLSPLDTNRVILEEALGKTMRRFNEAGPLLDAICGKVRVINGRRLPDGMTHSHLAHWLGAQIVAYYKEGREPKTCLIHGDCNFSNAIIDNALKVTLIDPRGYFGESKCVGIPDYDYAKILYSISGYDNFNSARLFKFNELDETSASFDIISDVPNELRAEFDELIGSRVRSMWVALIWINLGAYFLNNPIKACAAMLHGLYLATKIYEEQNNG
jgi:choline kinase